MPYNPWVPPCHRVFPVDWWPPMFDAEEWLRSVSDAVRWERNDAAFVEALRASSLSLGCQLRDVVVSSSGSGDRMAASDELVDHTELLRRGQWARDLVAEARRVFAGMRLVGVTEQEAANVLELVHLSLVPHGNVARMLGMSPSTERRRYRYGVDWLGGNGLAHAKAGRGLAVS